MKTVITLIQLRTILLLLPSICISTSSFSAADVNFHGTLIELTCKVGDNNPIDIDFGDEVVTDNIDGMHYIKTVPLSISCNQNYNGELNFTIQGTASHIENTALQTSVTDLGIRLINASDDSLIEVGKAYTHKDKDSVDLNVVPIKAENTTLKGGRFTATAQILVEPQ